MYFKLEFNIHKSTALSMMRYLNHRQMTDDDKKRVKRFLSRLRGDIAEIAINKSDVLKLSTREGVYIAPNNPIK